MHSTTRGRLTQREAMVDTVISWKVAALPVAANRLTYVGGVALTWDNNGNLLEDHEGTVYAYDTANRLIQVVQDGVTYTFSYRCMGSARGIPDCLRVTQSVNGEVMTYTWDVVSPLPQVLATADGATYVHGLDLVAEERSGTWAYPLKDALGSVRQWTDQDGHVTYVGDYTPYGDELSTAGATASAWGFAGEWADDTGLIYLRARYLEPQSGRFLTRDSWGGRKRKPGGFPLCVLILVGMGANVILTGCGTVTQAPTTVPTETLCITLAPTSTPSPTMIPTWTPSATPTSAPSATPSSTPTMIPTSTRTPPDSATPSPTQASGVGTRWISPFGAGVGYQKGRAFTGEYAHNGIDLVSDRDPLVDHITCSRELGCWYDEDTDCPSYVGYEDTEGREVVAVIEGDINWVNQAGPGRDDSIINLRYRDLDGSTYQVQYVHVRAAGGIVSSRHVFAGETLGWYGPYGHFGGFLHLHFSLFEEKLVDGRVEREAIDPEPRM
jgi:RHS repeat-associated protein